MKTRTQHVICWVEQYFDLIDVSAFCHILSVAGSNWNWRPYRLSLASRAGGLVTSRSQVSVQTVTLAGCEAADILILGCGELDSTLDVNETPWTDLLQAQPTYVALCNSTTALLQLGVPVTTLAVNTSRQQEVRACSPGVQFAPKDFHFDDRVLSCATLDVVPAALALIERQIGRSARRYVETEIGLTHSPIDLRGLDKLGH